MDQSSTLAYETRRGRAFRGTVEDVLKSALVTPYRGKIQLILTSPPFPLNRKKKYGNLDGDEYRAWLSDLAPLFREYLAPEGSIVIEMGNAWEPGEPVMSTLALRSLIDFLDAGGLQLCQQFICHNPARLPSPAQWVTVNRVRVKDSYTHVWWMSPTSHPKADNRRVMRPYSPSMERLLKTKKYNDGARPSEHKIGTTSFLRNNGGAIPSNVLSFSNTNSADPYLAYCREHELLPHPARMPRGLAEFFVKFLTRPGQYVLDPFAGSNVTGAVAESLKRRWLAIEPRQDYLDGSRGRFHAILNGTADHGE